MIGQFDELKAEFRRVDRRAIFALIYAAVGLTCISYFRDPDWLFAIVRGLGSQELTFQLEFGRSDNLVALLWWAFISVFFYFVVPAIWIKFISKRLLADVGLAPEFEKDFVRLLIGSIVVMLPIVYLMSLTDGFAGKYPFLKIYDGQSYIGWTLLIWEIAYFAQFFGLEFFFRGFLIHSLKPSIGIFAIPVMVIPYTMIHFEKPMPETFAAIFAGMFLGWISYRNGSIWLGLILHCTVAVAMDVLALYNKGLLF